MEPLHIADIQKNKTEVIRVEISEYKGQKLINIRTWYTNDAGELAPTKKGVALSVEMFNDLKNALLLAEDKLKSLESS